MKLQHILTFLFMTHATARTQINKKASSETNIQDKKYTIPKGFNLASYIRKKIAERRAKGIQPATAAQPNLINYRLPSEPQNNDSSSVKSTVENKNELPSMFSSQVLKHFDKVDLVTFL